MKWLVPAGAAFLVACGGTSSSGAPAPAPNPTSTASRAPSNGLIVPAGLTISIIANVGEARELAFAPNGDLFVGTLGSKVYVVPNADGASSASAPKVFADVGDSPAAGVAVDTSAQDSAIYVGSQFGVYRIPYTVGDESAQSAPVKIASVRPGGSGDHSTTSVAVVGSTLYASVGSSCDACTETDPTRATIQQMALNGSGMTPKAIHIRNAALAVNSITGTLWAGVAGQDTLPTGHPYEYFDPVSLHAGVADYGWPQCEENHVAYAQGANCSNTVAPRVEFPAYQTIIGAAFSAASPSGAYHLPGQYAGGAFVAMHGSWHTQNGISIAPPRVAFVPMSGDTPASAVDWSDPTKQWSDVVSGFQHADGSRIGRPTGVAIGPQGDLFVADDQTGNIYRVRP